LIVDRVPFIARKRDSSFIPPFRRDFRRARDPLKHLRAQAATNLAAVKRGGNVTTQQRRRARAARENNANADANIVA